MNKISLNGTWSLRQLGKNAIYPAKVPGTVLKDLLEAKAIPDPFFGKNEYEIRELFVNDYEYFRDFCFDKKTGYEHIELVFLGLDTLARVYINETEVLKADNMHRTWRVDIKDALRDGKNTIRIVFYGPLKYIKEEEQKLEIPIDNEPVGCIRGNQLIRKCHSQFGWDWGPQLPDAGIWRDIYIECFNGARLDNVLIGQLHTKDGVSLQITPEFEHGWSDFNISLTDPDGKKADYRAISDPQIWWPNNLGKQPLYTLEVSANGQVLTKKIGLRTLKISREKDKWGEEFCFCINGQKIFAFGANIIPEDGIISRTTRNSTYQMLSDAKAANFNCVRVWGGGIYPSDDFFSICDELGLIVWVDHMFACNIYNFTKAFEENISLEIRDNVRRIRHHASLGLWCGNNELETAWVNWEQFKKADVKYRADYIKQFEVTVPKVTKENDPFTDFWPASPSCGGFFEDPDSESKGDAHYWDVWHKLEPFKEYRNHYHRFCSEFGFQSFPSYETALTFTDEDDRNVFSEVFESHQKNGTANGRILNYLSQTFRYPKDFDSLLYVSQLLQAEAIRTGVEHWRAHRGRCMGAIYWQLNDCWPVASWSSIEYGGHWKALHYFAKRFFAPRIIADDGDAYYACNETKEIWNGEFDGVKFACPAFSSLKLADIKQEPIVYKHLKLEKPNYSVDYKLAGDVYEITIGSDTMAKFVELKAETSNHFSDNYFDLEADGKVTVTILADGTDIDSLKVRSLRDSY